MARAGKPFRAITATTTKNTSSDTIATKRRGHCAGKRSGAVGLCGAVVTAGSSNLYQSWEVVDPEKWVPHGFACVRVDSRGCGCSPGVIDHFSPRETKDFYDCIEWAGVQPWSNRKVGLNGISYYGINQWHVASLQPPHLAAIARFARTLSTMFAAGVPLVEVVAAAQQVLQAGA